MTSPSSQRNSIGLYTTPRTDREPVVETSQTSFINRDLSLLEFFRRVLEEALDERQPLLERLKFLSIFSSNLDEFFMIRVSGLKEQLDEASNQSDRAATLELLKEIRTRVTEMIDVQMKCLMSAVLPALKDKDVAIVDFESLTAHERDAMSRYFQDEIFPVLTPQAVD